MGRPWTGCSHKFLKHCDEIIAKYEAGEKKISLGKEFGIGPQVHNLLRLYAKTRAFVIQHEGRKYICEDFVPRNGTRMCDGNCPIDNCVAVSVASETALKKWPWILRDGK